MDFRNHKKDLPHIIRRLIALSAMIVALFVVGILIHSTSAFAATVCCCSSSVGRCMADNIESGDCASGQLKNGFNTYGDCCGAIGEMVTPMDNKCYSAVPLKCCVSQQGEYVKTYTNGLGCGEYYVAHGQTGWTESPGNTSCTPQTTTSQVPEPKKKNPVIFVPNVTIPGSDIFVKGGNVIINGRSIGEYVSAFYFFFAGVIGMIAAVMVLFAGFQWMTAGGNAGAVQKAKSTLYSSLIAIVLTFGSYLLLFTINPQLVQLPDLTTLANPIAPASENAGGTCASSAQAVLNSKKVFFPAGFSCETKDPKTTASAEIHDLAANTSCTMTTLASNACGNEQQISADTNLINGLGELALRCSYGINTIGGALHGATSNHYKGKAADIEIRETGYGDCARDVVTSIFCPKGVHVNKETDNGGSWIHLGPDVGKSQNFLDLCSS